MGWKQAFFVNLASICLLPNTYITVIFIFSTEHTETGNFSLQKSGRYNHSKEYVIKVATSQKFKLKYFSKENLRKHKSEWIKGGVYVFQNIA